MVRPRPSEEESRIVWEKTAPRKKRGRIKKLSFGSTKRAKTALRNVMSQMKYEMGLTYPKEFPMDGAIVKEQLHKLKQRLATRGIRCFWFLEFQKRGAAHFHAVLDKEIESKELKQIWYEIVGSGDEKHLRRGAHVAPIRLPKAMLPYLTNYLTKQEQKKVPESYLNLGRYWGYSLSLFPKHIKVILGTPEDIRIFRASLRSLRRWHKSRTRHWRRKRKKKSLCGLFAWGLSNSSFW